MDRPLPYRKDRQGPSLLQRLKQLTPASPEPDYERLAAYVFARRYAEGKTVADVGWGEIGRGSYLLAETAARVVGLTSSAEAAELAAAAHPAPNASYETAELPALPYPEDFFDVVVALGVVENLAKPEDFLAEVGRVLGQEGVFVVSVPDKDHDTRRRGSMYARGAEELLKCHFGSVRLYRIGAVAGGFVGPYSAETTDAGVQQFRYSAVDPTPDAGSPATRSILAVCGGAEVLDGKALLLLDRDRCVFEEHEDLARDVGLMWEEIDQMQQTEAQSFQDTLKLFQSEVSYLRARVRSSEARVRSLASESETRIRQLENHAAWLRDRVRNMENSATWRVFEPYRQLRKRIDAARGSGPKNEKETNDSARA